jgi:His/Glu/Gln/Arg/opine family amino acid ABC transporter permease subunit
MSEKKKVDVTQTFIYHEDAPTLPPPRLEVGAIAWLRQNLLGSPADILVTLISSVIVVVLVVGFFQWAVGTANWFAIINNQRLFMLESFEQEYEWRIALSVLLAAILTGVSFAVWARRSMRTLAMVGLGIVAILVILPIIVQATLSSPPSYLAAGNVEIVDRASTLLPQSNLAFIAQAGETVDVRLTNDEVADIETLKDLSGFSDRPTNALANAAQNRLDQRQAAGDTFDSMVNQDWQLTDDLQERTRLNIKAFVRTNDMIASTIEFVTFVRDNVATGDLSRLQLKEWNARLENTVKALEEPDEAVLSAIDAIDDSIADLANDDELGDNVLSAVDDLTASLIESASLEDIGESLVNNLTLDLIGAENQSQKQEELIILGSQESEFLRTMFVMLLTPQSVIETYNISQTSMQIQILDGQTLDVLSEGVVTPDGAVVSAEILTDGWYVLSKSPVEGEEGTAILAVNGIFPIIERTLTANESEYVRLTDNELSVIASRPVIDGDNVPFAILIDNQYRGLRDLQAYLVHFIPLFFEQLVRLFVPLMLAVAWGFVIGRGIAHFLGEESHFNNNNSRLMLLGASILPLLVLLLYFGFADGSDGIIGAILKIVLVAGSVFLAGQIDSWLTSMNSGEDAEANITSILMYSWGIFPVAMFVLASGIGGLSGAALGSAVGGLIWLVIMYFVGINYQGMIGYGLLIGGFFLQIVQSFIVDTVWDTWTTESITPIFVWILFAIIGTGAGLWGYSMRSSIDFSIKRTGYLTSGIILALSIIAPSILSPDSLDPQIIGGIGLLAWLGLMFFTGVHYWSGSRLASGLLILTFLWLQIATSIDLWSSVYFIIWLSVGMVMFNRGYEAGRVRKIADSKDSPMMQRFALPGMIVAAVAWLVVLIIIPMIVNALGTNGILQTSPNELLPLSDKRSWGGLMLTMQLTILGVGASFPIGLALALGRRSSLPVVKTACIIYIETVRGVPLITILFLATLLVPLIDPTLATIEGAVRVWVGVTMFGAAYLAENVRGGLQSIPSGQTEAAQAIGLSSWQITLHILLPQALRAIIPALVGQFISVFKDTSLVVIVGLAEITGIANRVVAQPEFLQKRQETYLYIAIIYFVFSYIMSYISRRVEETGSGAARAQQI